jgi:hypothetical protein
MAALVGLLSAAQLLPFLDLLGQSHRSEHYSEGVWAMPGTGWANLLVPLFGCFKTSQATFFQPDQYWTSSYYAGIGVLALGFLALRNVRQPHVRLLGLVVGLGLILALGERGYLLPLLRRFVPQIGYLRYPVKAVVWVSFCLPLLAAFGLRELHRCTGPTLLRSSVLRLAVGLTLVIAGLAGFAVAYPQRSEEWQVTLLNGALRVVALWVCLAACLAAQSARSTVLRALVVLLVAADLLTAVPHLAPTVPRVVLRPDFPQPSPRPEFGQSRAMVTFAAHKRFNSSRTPNLAYDFVVKRSALFGDANLIDAIPKLDGFYSLYLDHADTVLSALYLQTNRVAVTRILTSTNPISFAGLYAFLGVSQISVERTNYEWSVRTNFMPLFSSGQEPVRTNDAAALAGLLRPDFDPRRRVYLPEGTQENLAAEAPEPAEFLATRFRANTLEAAFKSSQPTWLLVAQSFHPNWRAFVDGHPAMVLRANVAFQAVRVPAGRHVLNLRYVDRGFLAGLVVSVFALLAAVAARRHAKRKGPGFPPGP